MRGADVLLGELMETTTRDGGAAPAVAPAVDIAGLTADSRKVDRGFLFAALPGNRVDGRAFVAEAIKRGAAAVLAPAGGAAELAGAGVPVIEDANPRRRLALMAARFYAHQPETVVAVTGTNGKTSTASFVRQMWAHMGLKAGSLGTLGLDAPCVTRPGALTTPDPVELHALLRDLAAAGVDHLAMEASSHGLDQYRLDGVRLAAAAFTNLSRDHLDYHPSMEAYLAAKARLFSELLPPGASAVLNADDQTFAALRDLCRERNLKVTSFGTRSADLLIETVAPRPDGQRLELTIDGHQYEVDLPLAGMFQAANAVAALGLVLASGGELAAALDAMGHLQGVRGRLEKVAERRGATVFVDYAHTPDALATALVALRPHARGGLSVVFGCGGDRDPGKRPQMGQVAARLADRVVVTDDNPRTEDPEPIRRQIAAACPNARVIGDRREAIGAAVAALRPGDVLLIAGKGHETGQIVGNTVLPFDDAQVARAAVSETED